MRVLEIGTGSGYQAAVLAECARTEAGTQLVPLASRHKGVQDDAQQTVEARINSACMIDRIGRPNSLRKLFSNCQIGPSLTNVDSTARRDVLHVLS
jgi:hypothetical protein